MPDPLNQAGEVIARRLRAQSLLDPLFAECRTPEEWIETGLCIMSLAGACFTKAGGNVLAAELFYQEADWHAVEDTPNIKKEGERHDKR